MSIEETRRHATPPPDWIGLVERIRSFDEERLKNISQARVRPLNMDALEELYHLFSRGIRFHFCREIGPQDLDDKIHDTFLIVVRAICRGDLREPERLMGFVRTIIRRQVAAHIDRVVHNRRDRAEFETTAHVPDTLRNPEEAAIFRQRIQLIRQVLRELPERERKILTRFYIDEHTQDRICSDMDLTETQFRLLKSRAKARFGEMGKKKLNREGPNGVLARLREGHRRP